MSSEFQSQVLNPGLALHSYQDNNPRSNGVHECASILGENNIGHSGHNSQHHENFNHNDRNEEYEYDDVDADYDHQLEKTSSSSYYENEERSKNFYKGLIKNQTEYENLINNHRTRERSEGLEKFKDTFPEDPIVQRTWVKKIFDAILDLDGIIDKKTKYHNNSSQAARRIRDGYYPDIEIEKTAWRLMLNARDAQIGVHLIEKYHGIKTEDPIQNGVGVFETWADRMNAIINTLRVSKAACKQLMDPHYLDRLVECPNAERQMKKNNKRINTERDIQNQLGRKLLDLKVVPVADVEKEAQKLQHIKEAHRQAAPPKTPRIKKEDFLDDSSSIYLSQEKSSLLTQKKELRGRKRKQSLRRKKLQALDEKNSDLDRESEFSTRTETTIDSDISLTPKVFTQKFDPDLMSAITLSPCVAESSVFGSNRQVQELNGFHSNHTASYLPLNYSMNLFHPDTSRQLGSLDVLTHDSQSTFMDQEKLDKFYSEIICNLLGVDTFYGKYIPLKYLRIYAHAYNEKYLSCLWTHPELSPHKARGCCVHNESTGEIHHISHYFPCLTGLALLRGDLDQNYCMVPKTQNSQLFTNGNQLMDQALGVIDNPCGTCGISYLSPFHIIKDV